MSSYPGDLRYTKDHEWVRLAADRGTVGVTDHAQKQLGDVVFVELPEVGTSLTAGQRFGTVESVKAVSELYSPVGGEVVEVHAALAESPEIINTDPYGQAWMVVVKLADPSAVAALMDAAQYQAYVESEAKH
jgi:glycine cleavage system H protein